jgi:predicted amidohydrolase
MENLTSSGNKITTDKLKAGFIQFNPELGNPEKNMEMLAALITKGREANLLVIPELANSGYNFKSKSQAFNLAEDLCDSRFLEFLIQQSREHQLYLVAGMNEKENGKLYNTAVLVSPQGLIGKYRKIHLFLNEFDFFEKGDIGLPVFNLAGLSVGILICFDWVFPEVWRILALKGADVICHPSNLVLPYAQQAVPVHGMINKTYVITANRYGVENGIKFSGQSFICDPEGKMLRMAKSSVDDVDWDEFDLAQARDKKMTSRNDVLKDRHPEDYQELFNSI